MIEALVKKWATIRIPDALKHASKEAIFEVLGEQEFFCNKHKSKWVGSPTGIFFGLVSYSICPACKRERELEEQREIEREAREAEEYRTLSLELLGVTKRHFKDLERGVVDTPFYVKHKGLLDTKDGDFVDTRPLLLFNSCGVGKSFLAQQMVIKAWEIGQSYRIIKGEELQARFECLEISGGYHRTNSLENLSELLEQDCVIIDEVDNITKPVVLNRLLGALHDACKRFILIGNCNVGDFFASLEPKIVDRLVDKVSGAFIYGGDFESMRTGR